MKTFKNTQLQFQPLYSAKRKYGDDQHRYPGILLMKVCYVAGFLYYLPYVGFIFSLSFTCYCIGLTVAFTQRHHFLRHKDIPSESTEMSNKLQT
jgi:hypothetical protein